MGGRHSAAAGLAIAWKLPSIVIAKSIPENVFTLTPDWRVCVYAAGMAVVACIAFGLAPALRAARVDLAPLLKQSASNLGFGHQRMRLTRSLVVSQIALSLVLLFGAGLFVRTLVNLQMQNVGFAREDRKSTRLNSSHSGESRMPSSA